jgi:hypothetical protein
MKNNVFLIVFLCVLCLCLAATAAHFIYTVYAYEHCSIIYFIGEEPWGK